METKKYILILMGILFVLSGCSQPQKIDDGSIQAPKNEDFAACTMEYDPVCGDDGITYGNSCQADVAKVKFSIGACENQS